AEQVYHDAVPNDAPGALARALLWLPARIWDGAVRFRNTACDQGWLVSRRLEAFTVSVGNLTAGGNGKNPMGLWLLEQLEARGFSSAVLTRGYRRKSGQKVTVLEGGPTGVHAAEWLGQLRKPAGGPVAAQGGRPTSTLAAPTTEETGDEAQIIR